MGNATSCAPLVSTNGVVKVLLSNGRLKIFTKTVKAAELMVENPGHFLCDSNTLKVGHRIPGVSADEELERRRFYFLLPMDLLYSVLTQEELNSFTYKASKALKHGSFNTNFGKIIPVLSEFCIFPSEGKRVEDDSVPVSNAEVEEQSYAKQRSWQPALETIVEAPS